MPLIGISESVYLASGARSVLFTGAALLSPDDSGQTTGIEFVLDLTTFTVAAALTLSIEEFDEAAQAWRIIISSAVISAVGTARLRYGPTIPGVANVAATGYLGKRLRASVAVGNANSCTYSISVKRAREV